MVVRQTAHGRSSNARARAGLPPEAFDPGDQILHLQFQWKPSCFAQISADCLLTVSPEIPLSQQRYSCPHGQMPHMLDPSAISGFLERCGSDKAIPSHISREDLVSATARWTRTATFGHKGRLPVFRCWKTWRVQIGSPLALAFVACLAEDARLARLWSWPLWVSKAFRSC